MKLLNLLFSKRFLQTFAITWAVLIATISSIPNLPNPEIPENNFITFRLDYLFHFCVFFVLGMAVVLWQIPGSLKLTFISVGLILLLGTAFGIVDEVHQLIIPGRRYNPIDLFYNLFGYWTGVLLSYLFFVRYLMVESGRFSGIKKILDGRR
jgi:VanZ family protein